MGDSLLMRLSVGVLVIAVCASSTVVLAQEAESEGNEGGVPVVEGEHPGVVIVEQQDPPPPPGYEDEELTPVPVQEQEQPPGYGQQPAPGYGQQQPAYGQQQPGYGYGQQARYHREPYVEGMPLPPNAQVVTRVRKGLLVPGIVMFVAGYLSMVFTYTFMDDVSREPPPGMLVPLVGPFFLMPDASEAGRTLLGFDALLQIGGMTMLILGATLKAKYVTWYGDSNIRVAPLASRSGGGMQLSVAF